MQADPRRIELLVRSDFQDYWRATCGYMLRQWKVKLFLAGAGAALPAFLFLSIQSPRNPPYPLLIPAAGVTVLFVFLYLNARTVFASKKFLQGTVRYIFSADGVEALARSAPGMKSWPEISRAIELKHDFLIFYTPERMYAIPKRCFPDPRQMDAFRNMLQSHLGPRAALLED